MTSLLMLRNKVQKEGSKYENQGVLVTQTICANCECESRDDENQ